MTVNRRTNTRDDVAPERAAAARVPTPVTPSPAHIHLAIRRYAEAYAALQELQEQSTLIPVGDQKTGSIGEFYVRLYLEARHPGATISFGGHSESGWDMEVTTDARTWRVQVKTVSAFAAMRRTSPIKSGWDELHVIHLDRAFSPTGFWVIPDPSCMGTQSTMKSRCCPNPLTGVGGSKDLPFGPNGVAELVGHLAPLLNPD